MSEKPAWYYSVDGQKLGPVSGRDLKRLAASGEIKPSSLVWKQGMANWAAAKGVKGLFADPSDHASASEKPQTPPKIDSKAGATKPNSSESARSSSDPPDNAGEGGVSKAAKNLFGAIVGEAGRASSRIVGAAQGVLHSSNKSNNAQSKGRDSLQAEGDSTSQNWKSRVKPYKWQLAGCLGIPLLLIISCTAITGVTAYLAEQKREEQSRQEREEKKKKYEEAETLWASGEKDKAIVLYRDLIAGYLSLELYPHRPKMYQRVIEHDVKNGDTSSARTLMKKARRYESVELSFSDSLADSILKEVEEELQEEKRKDEAERQQRAIEEQKAKEREEFADPGPKPVSSAWDASVAEVKKYLADSLNDPKSLECVEWSEVKKTEWQDKTVWAVRCKYRAKNGFGAYITKNQIFFIRDLTVVFVRDF